MATLKKVHGTHVASNDEEARQWMQANPSFEVISIYPCSTGVKIWWCRFEEVKPEKPSES